MGRRVVAALALAVSIGLSGCGSSGSGRATASNPAPTAASQPATPPASGPTRTDAAASFLARYVTADGRVIRHDQGGDIVSEGQAYGMLVAELAGRPEVVRTIWGWTAAHLRRPDGLLKFHASGSGRIEDDQSASDADTLAAYALLRYDGPGADALHAAGKRLADAVLSVEAVTSDGAPVIVAGPWATATAPPTVNPSYLMPSVFDALARLTGDDRWQQAATTSVALLAGLTDDGSTLPTDWAQLSDGHLAPIAALDGSAPVQYGLDAQRLPLWFATACSARAKRLAAHWWTNRLHAQDRAGDLALAPDGTPIDTATNPLPLLAAAAAAQAAGDRQASDALRARAAQQAHDVPTYYGDAWLALGSALLDGALDPCREAAGG